MDPGGADDSEMSCPLCLEDMDSTDRKFQPCHCGYQICLWCWHHIMEMAKKDSLEGRCPACRSPYDKEKIVSGPSNERDELPESGAEKKQKFGKGRSKATAGGLGPTGGPPITGVDARKHLSNVRVVQRNLVYVVGMPYSLADEETLERKEYFGQYGRILKIAVSRSNSAISNASATMHGPTANVYVTFVREEDAVRCIHAVDGCMFEGRILRACFGTTKYCNAWLKNMVCPNPDCLYLHEVGTQEDSFTKEEMLHRYNTAAATAGGSVTSVGPGINPASSKHHSQYDSGPPVNRRAANGLPPPLDGYLMDRHASLATSMGPNAAAAASGRSNPPNGPPPGSTGKVVTAGATSSVAGTTGGGILPPAASWGAKGASAAGKLILSAPRPYGAVTAGGTPQSTQGLLLSNGGMGATGSAPASSLPSATPMWPAPSASTGPYSSSPPTSMHPGGSTSSSLGAGRTAQQSHLLSSTTQQFKPSAAVLSGRVIQASAHTPPVFGSAGSSMGAMGPPVSTAPSGAAAAVVPGSRGSVGDRLRKSPPSPFQHSPPPAGHGGTPGGGALPGSAGPPREIHGNGAAASGGAENPLRPQGRHDPWGQGSIPAAATASQAPAAPAAGASVAAGAEGVEGGAGQAVQGQRLSDVVSGSTAAVLRDSGAGLGSSSPSLAPGIAPLPIPGTGASSPAGKASALPTRSKSRLVVLGHTSTASPKAAPPTSAAAARTSGTSPVLAEPPSLSGRESLAGEASSQAKGQLLPSKASSGSNSTTSLTVPPGFGLAAAAAANSGRSLEEGARPGASGRGPSQGATGSVLGESPTAEAGSVDGPVQGGGAAEDISLKAWQGATGQPHKFPSESDLSLDRFPGAVGFGNASLVARMAEVARQLKQRRLQGMSGTVGGAGGVAEEWRLMEGVALGSKEEEWQLIQGILEMPRQAGEGGSRRSQGGSGRNGAWVSVRGAEAEPEAEAEEEAEFSWDASWLAAAAISTSLKARSVSAQDVQPDAAAAAAAAMLATASASPKDPLAGWLLDTLASGGSSTTLPASAGQLPGAVAAFAFAPLSQAFPPSSQRQSRFSFARGPNGVAGNHVGKGQPPLYSALAFSEVGALSMGAQGAAPGAAVGTGVDALAPGVGRMSGLAVPPGFGARPGVSSLSSQAEGGRGVGTLSAPPGFPVQPRAFARAAPEAEPAARASGVSSFLPGFMGSAGMPADAEMETAAVLAEQAATTALGEGTALSLGGARWQTGAGAGLGGTAAVSSAPVPSFLSSTFAAGGESSAFGEAAGTSQLGARGQVQAQGQASWGFGSALSAPAAAPAWGSADASLGASLGLAPTAAAGTSDSSSGFTAAAGTSDSSSGFFLPGYEQSAGLSQHLLGMFQASGTRPNDGFGRSQLPGGAPSSGQAGAWMNSGLQLGPARSSAGTSAQVRSRGEAAEDVPVALRGSSNAAQTQQPVASQPPPSSVLSPQTKANGFKGRQAEDGVSKESSASSAALEPWQLLPDDSSVDSAVATPSSLGLRGLGGLSTSRLPALLARGGSNGPHASTESAEGGGSLVMKATSRRLGGRYGFGLEPEEGDA